MDSRPVKIYVTRNVPRLRYIADIILGDILGVSWEVITDKRKLGRNPVINYSSEKINGSFKINPNELLFETGLKSREIPVNEWKGLPVFFQTTIDSDFPFDIFAASFFLISRYEEYLEFQPDEYGRFKASSSLAFRHGFLSIPIVDIWTKEFAKNLLKKFQILTFKRNEYKALLTIDTDQPFAYLGKSLFNFIGSLFGDIKNKTGKATERYACVAKGEKDPYEVFDYIIDNVEKTGTDVRFFFPVGDHSKYDQNPSWKNDNYRKLIAKIAARYIVGLHPSFNASGNSAVISTEAARLKAITSKEILISRFHYIRILMPQSFLNTQKSGIKEDYSMGYPDEPGFRAGIARPYYFYDIAEDHQTSLRIVPFQMMDATLSEYKKLNPILSKEVIIKLIDETRKAGGLFVSIWHNTSLLESPDYKDWKNLFEFMLKYQTS